MFKVLDDGMLVELELSVAKKSDGLGTGAAVADLNNDGVLELLLHTGKAPPNS